MSGNVVEDLGKEPIEVLAGYGLSGLPVTSPDGKSIILTEAHLVPWLEQERLNAGSISPAASAYLAETPTDLQIEEMTEPTFMFGPEPRLALGQLATDEWVKERKFWTGEKSSFEKKHDKWSTTRGKLMQGIYERCGPDLRPKINGMTDPKLAIEELIKECAGKDEAKKALWLDRLNLMYNDDAFKDGDSVIKFIEKFRIIRLVLKYQGQDIDDSTYCTRLLNVVSKASLWTVTVESMRTTSLMSGAPLARISCEAVLTSKQISIDAESLMIKDKTVGHSVNAYGNDNGGQTQGRGGGGAGGRGGRGGRGSARGGRSGRRDDNRDNRDAAPRRCNNCNKTGHFMAECPSKICMNCGKKGHVTKFCELPYGGSSKPDDAASVNATKREKREQREQESSGDDSVSHDGNVRASVTNHMFSSAFRSTDRHNTTHTRTIAGVMKVRTDVATAMTPCLPGATQRPPVATISKNPVKSDTSWCEPKCERVCSYKSALTGPIDSCKENETFVLDCAAAVSVAPTTEGMVNIRATNGEAIRSINGKRSEAVAIGDTMLKGIDGCDVELRDVLIVPEAQLRAACLHTLSIDGYEVTFKPGGIIAHIRWNGRLVARAVYDPEDGLYKIEQQTDKGDFCILLTTLEKWHRRLMHTNMVDTQTLLRNGLIKEGNSLDDGVNYIKKFCETCQHAKQHATSFKKNKKEGELEMQHFYQPGEKFSIDVLEMDVVSAGGCKYALECIDDASGMKFGAPLTHKSTALFNFKKMMLESKALSRNELLCVRYDQGGENISQAFKNYLAESGVQVELTMKGSHAQMAQIDQSIKTSKNRTRALIIDAHLPKYTWVNAYKYQIVVGNYVPSKRARKCKKLTDEQRERGVTPWEAFTGRLPSIAYLRRFGCKVTYKHPSDTVGALDHRSATGRFFGVAPGGLGGIVWDPVTDRHVYSRNICFAAEWEDDSDAPGSLPSDRGARPTRDRESVQQHTSTDPVQLQWEREYQSVVVDVSTGDVYDVDMELTDATMRNSKDVAAELSVIDDSNDEKWRNEKRTGPSDRAVGDYKESTSTTTPQRYEMASPIAPRVGERRAPVGAEMMLKSASDSPLSPMRPQTLPLHLTPSSPVAGSVQLPMVTRTARVPAETVALPIPTRSVVEPRRSTRSSHAPQRLVEDPKWVNVCGIEQFDINGETLPISLVKGDRIIARRGSECIVMSVMVDDPKRVGDILAMEKKERDEWLKAMNIEHATLVDGDCFVFERRPPHGSGSRVLKSTWAFKTKRNAQMELIKRKARACVQGCGQRPGIDFEETYAPVIKFATWRIIMALACIMGWSVKNWDIIAAYIRGELDESDPDILIEQFEGIDDWDHPKRDWVLRLLKGLYGMRQSGRLWYRTQDSKLLELGYKRNAGDPCVYVKFDENGTPLNIMGTYVDDATGTGPDVDAIDAAREEIHKIFPLTDCGDMTEFLRLGVKRDVENKLMFFQQSESVLKVHELCFGEDAKTTPVDTPFQSGVTLSKDMCPSTDEERRLMEDVPYNAVVGVLVYLSMTFRPDIAEIVSEVSQFNANPGSKHWDAVKRIAQYLMCTVDYGLLFDGNGIEAILQENGRYLLKAMDGNLAPLSVYADAEWASNPDHRRSRGGMAAFLGRNLVAWKAWTLKAISDSSTEAEYIAAHKAMRQVQWQETLINGMGFDLDEPPCLLEDNQGAIAMAKDNRVNERTKHIAIKYHAIRERMESGALQMVWIPTGQQWADGMTKSRLTAEQFRRNRRAIGVMRWIDRPKKDDSYDIRLRLGMTDQSPTLDSKKGRCKG